MFVGTRFCAVVKRYFKFSTEKKTHRFRCHNIWVIILDEIQFIHLGFDSVFINEKLAPPVVCNSTLLYVFYTLFLKIALGHFRTLVLNLGNLALHKCLVMSRNRLNAGVGVVLASII